MNVNRILIVDDKIENIRMAGAILQKKGYNLLTARNGRRALEVCEKTTPDMILLDIRMPEMDGFECCEKLKQHEHLKEVPVIFLSADKDTADIVKGFEVGAVDYVFKPFNTLELLSRIDNHLSLRKARLELQDLTEKASRYISPHVFNALFTGSKNTTLETHEKFLTIFFSDIVNFTQITSSMGDRVLTDWLNNYCDKMAKIAHKHGGTLDKFIGDAVMVFFGDPESKGEKEDAIACVQMALEMIQEAKGLGIEIRVGLNSGLAYVGNFGTRKQMNYTIIGNAVNLAARLEHSCDPGTVLISQSTYDLVNDEYWCDVLGGVKCKGFDEDIMTYRVIA